MKKYLTLFLFILTTTLCFGQNNYQDVVYLKNGSIIRGTIIEQVPNESIKIETSDKSVFVYEMKDIEKIAKEESKTKNRGAISDSGLKVGYKGIVEWGYQVGVGDAKMDRLKLNIINGYQLNPYFSLGLGTGLRYYLDENAVTIPVFLDFRANFIDNKTSPYLSLGVGYSLSATDKMPFTGGGFLLNPTLGASFKVSEKTALIIGIGYEMQRFKFQSLSYYTHGNLYTYEEVRNYGAISIEVGISF